MGAAEVDADVLVVEASVVVAAWALAGGCCVAASVVDRVGWVLGVGGVAFGVGAKEGVCSTGIEVGCMSFCQGLFILLISSTGYTLTVESSPAGSTALVPLGDPD